MISVYLRELSMLYFIFIVFSFIITLRS